LTDIRAILAPVSEARTMDDLIYCALGVALFVGFGVYAALLKRL
jgi:hypothetical protein